MTGDPTRDDHATPKHFESLPVSDYVAEREVREAKQRARQDAAHEAAKAERYEDTCGRVITVVDGLVDTACGRPSGHDGDCSPTALAQDREEGET